MRRAPQSSFSLNCDLLDVHAQKALRAHATMQDRSNARLSRNAEQRTIYRAEDIGIQQLSRGAGVVVELLRAADAHDGRRHIRLSQHPRKSQLRHCHTCVRGDRFELLHGSQKVVIVELQSLRRSCEHS